MKNYSVLVDNIDDNDELSVILAVINQRYSPYLHESLKTLQKHTHTHNEFKTRFKSWSGENEYNKMHR